MWKEYICNGDCELYLQNLFNSMSEGIALHKIIYDDSGNPIDYIFLEVNDNFLDILGLKRETVINHSVKEIIPSLEQEWINLYEEVALTGKSIELENYSSNLGRYFKIHALSPIKGQFVTFFIDITNIKRANESLIKHQILFDNAQDIVLHLKSDGSIIDANKYAALRYGYSHDELLELNIKDLRHPSTLKYYEQQMRMSDTLGIIFECVHMTKSGTNFPVEVSSKNVLVGDEYIRVHIIRDITERKKSEEKITYLANYDSLTGIPNRSFLLNQLDSILENSQNNGKKVALMLFDIDKFKKVNDVYGHEAGDIVLKGISSRIQNILNETGVIGRLGGDEFVIFQPDYKDINYLKKLADQIIEAAKEPIDIGTAELIVSVSIGISIFPDDSFDRAKLIIMADDAMYSAKQNGGSRYHFFDKTKSAIKR